ncbi:MAG: hypothetical protein WC509_00145 [Candidatus Izemoplasmatales bacterium]
MRQLFVSFFVFLFVIISTHLTYQYWLENDSGLQWNDAVAYSYASQVVKLSAPSGKRLVPVGAVLGRNDVNEVSYRYSVALEEGHEFEVQLVNVTIRNANATYENVNDMLLFEHEVETGVSSQANVTVTIRLRMPSTEEERAMIQGSTVSFQLNFIQRPVD